jgi:phage-related protein
VGRVKKEGGERGIRRSDALKKGNKGIYEIIKKKLEGMKRGFFLVKKKRPWK